MNSNIRGKNVLPKWSVLLVLLTVTAVASAQHNKPSAPAAPSHASAPHAAAPHASAPAHSAPAQHPGGAGANNRGPGGANANNRGPAGANKGGAAGANNRGPGGANANNRGAAGANKGGAAGTNNRGAAGTNNRGGANNANNRGGASANNRGNAGANANRHQPAGSKTVSLKSGGSATFRKDGQVRTIHTKSGMTINHGARGGRHIESMHNGRRVVSYGRHGGYSQRAYYRHGGREYSQRTYYRGGHYYAYGYRNYYYGGRPYYGYAPSFYYGPAYYGWAYNPWPAPVAYGWGWGGAPWYGYYGPYFAPYPVYPTAAFWLTDYLIAANLQAAYAAQQEAAAGGDNGELMPLQLGPESSDMIASLWTTDPLIAANLEAAYGQYMLGAAAPAAKGNATGLSADVKKELADEMKNEIAAEKDAAANGQKDAPSGDQVPAALDPKIRIFVVSTDEDLTTSDSVECSLTPGDVVYRTGDKPDDDNMVDATVKSSKKDECAVGATVGVPVDDLQEMHNQLRIQMDAGLKELADKQGKNGLPAAPDTKTQAGEVPAPSPDTSVGSDLKAQQQEADQAEAEAKQPQ